MKSLFIKKLFYPPNYLLLPRIGVDISNNSIKYVEFSNKKGEIKLKNFGIISSPENLIKDGEIMNKNLLVKSLVELKNMVKQNFVSVSIPEEKTFIFNIEIPNVPDSLIRQSIEFRLEENVPFKADEVEFEYDIIKKSKEKDGNILLSVSVIQKRVISELTEIFNSAGFMPVNFQIESRAIARSVVPRSFKTYMVVNIKDDTTILSIVNRSTVLLSSIVPIGENMIKQSLLRGDSSTYKNDKISDEVFSMKASYEDDTYSSIINIFSILKDEIEKFNEFLIARSANKKSFLPDYVDKIVVCGRSAALPGFLSYISQNFDTETVLANVWSNSFDLDEYIPNVKFTDSLNFASAVGNALPEL